MNRMKIRFSTMIAVLVGVLLSTFLNGPTVRAVEGESITISPASKPYKLKAGEVIKDKLTVINDGTVGYMFKVYAAPYSVKNRSYEPDYSTTTPNADLQTWVRFDQQSVHLEPNERTEISYTVTVPTDATPGGHYGVLFAETQPQQSEQIARKKRVGTIVYATIQGQYVQAGKELSTTISPLQIGGPVSGMLTVENTGNTDFTMTNSMTAWNIVGSEVYKKSHTRIILPKTTRDIPVKWENGPELGIFRIETTTDILGKQVAHQHWVLVAPIWFLITVFAVLGLFAFWIVRRIRG